MTPLAETYRDSVATVGCVENLLVVRLDGAVEGPHVRAVAEAYRRALIAHPAGVATAVLALGGVPRFGDELRRAVVELADSTEEGALGTAFIVLPRGLFAAAVRAFMSGVFLASRSKEPLKVFAEIDEAAVWLPGILGDAVPWTPARVADVLYPLAIAEAS